MKKAITLRLCIVIVLSMFATTILSYYIQVKTAKEAMYNSSIIRINQVSQIIEKNDEEIKLLNKNLKEDYFIRAKAAAYIVQNHPEVIGNLSEMKKIASLLQMDELHLFDKEGTLYTGTEPRYYGYTFNSGEQMQFFLPMINDYSLQLCQDVTPNTAESKLMQYIAVWREDHKGIVQIGMEPKRLLAAMEKNELSHIFTMISAEKGINIFVVDAETGDILGSTDRDLTGKNGADIGLEITELNIPKEDFTIEINGKRNYGVIQQEGQILIGVTSTYENLYKNIPANMAVIIFSLSILAIVIILLILMALDKFIILRIYEIIAGMKKIAAGDLDAYVEVTNLPEFVELSNSVNNMVMSLLASTNKLSLAFQNINIQIAVYEYNQDMKRVLATSKIGDILMLQEEELSKILSDRELFFEKIKQICAHPFEQENDVYLLRGDTTRYVKIKSYQKEHTTLGIIVDVTEELVEKQGIKLERDIDLLTGLYSRRAFFAEMDRIFRQPNTLKVAVLLMVDLDNLKYVNDNWGHEYGDKLLNGAADLLANCEAPNKVASRLSGDEFVLMIHGADSQEELQKYMDNIYAQMMDATIDIPDGGTIPVRMSGGYIFYPGITDDYNEMLRLADKTMYKVKKGTKGHFEKYQPEN